jgi:hypothetical protein
VLSRSFLLPQLRSPTQRRSAKEKLSPKLCTSCSTADSACPCSFPAFCDCIWASWLLCCFCRPNSPQGILCLLPSASLQLLNPLPVCQLSGFSHCSDNTLCALSEKAEHRCRWAGATAGSANGRDTCVATIGDNCECDFGSRHASQTGVPSTRRLVLSARNLSSRSNLRETSDRKQICGAHFRRIDIPVQRASGSCSARASAATTVACYGQGSGGAERAREIELMVVEWS